MAAKSRIPELQSIEFNGSASIKKYSQKMRDIARDLSWEADFAAEELQAILARQGKGHPLLMGVDTKLRARKVAKRLHRASELLAGAGVEAVKLYEEFRLQFADIIKPQKPKKQDKFDFDDA
jgi:hypothetical protein